jgi:hypothetical protein
LTLTMKKILYIFIFLFTVSGSSFAQDEQEDAGGKLRDKMVEYIQKKLSMSKDEAEKFQPIFLDYLRQMKSTKQEFKTDPILLRQKVAELRVTTRDQLKPIIGEQRSNDVFVKEVEFIKAAKNVLNDRIESRANKKSGFLQ